MSYKGHRGIISPRPLLEQGPLQICLGATLWDSPQLFKKPRMDSRRLSPLSTSSVPDAWLGLRTQ